MSYIITENLTKIYGDAQSAFTAVDGVDFTIEAGEFVALMGESGAGKSTILSIMGAMNTPTSGRYIVDDIDVYGLAHEKKADFRREFLGFVFQSFHLIPYLTVVENVMLPLTTMPMNRKLKRDMAMRALTGVGLEKKADRLPNQISGGENERVAVARAIVNDPPVLLADEPTGNLDTRTSREVMTLLEKLNQGGMTIVMVTHSRECAEFAHRILTISDGKLVAPSTTASSLAAA